MKQEDKITKLARQLKAAGVDKETGVTISLQLRKPGKVEQMIDWLEKNRRAPPEAICKKSREIARA